MKRFHVHIGVDDLTKSVAFYSKLFDAEPSVNESDYAKWMLEDPRINFAISQGHTKTGVEHLGIQTDNEAELLELQTRVKDMQTFDEQETQCCYARSNKTWVADPQDVIWETFHSMGSLLTYGKRPEMEQDCCK